MYNCKKTIFPASIFEPEKNYSALRQENLIKAYEERNKEIGFRKTDEEEENS